MLMRIRLGGLIFLALRGAPRDLVLFTSAAQTSTMASPASLGDLPRAVDVSLVVVNGRWRKIEILLDLLYIVPNIQR